MKKILLIILLLLFVNNGYAVNNILLCNIDSDTSFRPAGYCSIPAMTRIGALTLNSGENNSDTAVIDTANGFAYYATRTFPAYVVKVRLSDFTRISRIQLPTGEGGSVYSIIDITNGFMYVACTETSPAKITKIRLSDFTRIGVLQFSGGMDSAGYGVIDMANGFMYWGGNIGIAKVSLSTFTQTAFLALAADDDVASMVIDTTNNFIYIGTLSTTAKILEINLSSFTQTNSVTLPTAEGNLYCSAIDITSGFAYFGTSSSYPYNKVKKLRLLDFTIVGTLSFLSGESGLREPSIDLVNNYLYIPSYDMPGVISIDLSTFTKKSTLVFTGSEYNSASSIIDIANQNIYIGNYVSPTIITKVGICGD